ncbi:hypothetical protein [Paratractidigestivibacter sp.]|uniref:hypothetical protein n=1 Tax=Paratractidigestivibacter sp. TaxID=2847316 RepID=UPI002AC9DEF8|nr:hypothetical protein [Paratractidigestivibacter sp.]
MHEDEELESTGQEEEVATEPADLADAWSRLSTPEPEPTNELVESTGPDEGADEDLAGVGGPVDEYDSYEGTDDYVGGEPTTAPDIDYSSYETGLTNSIKKQAEANVTKLFHDNEIRYWKISDLYSRDERTGEVLYRDPDSGERERYFDRRGEAEAWIQSKNKEINDTYREMVRAESQKLNKDYAPIMRMYQFAPTWNQMSADEQFVFNQIVAPYAIQSNGQTIGYNVDLMAVAKQARNIASSYNTRSILNAGRNKGGKKKQQEATGPAVDMDSRGSTDTDSAEPKNLAEAFSMINKKG